MTRAPRAFILLQHHHHRALKALASFRGLTIKELLTRAVERELRKAGMATTANGKPRA